MALPALERQPAESSVLSWLGSPMFRWIVAAAVPSAAFGILVQNPALDVRVEIPWVHLMLVTVVGLISIILSLLIMRVAARQGTRRNQRT